jgi:serine/threonine protein kinase
MSERFTLLSELGRGGMGVVWKARDEETGQIVALKLMRDVYADDPDYVARFERELELSRRIDSENVVKVLGYGVRKRTPYLAFEYVAHSAEFAHSVHAEFALPFRGFSPTLGGRASGRREASASPLDHHLLLGV